MRPTSTSQRVSLLASGLFLFSAVVQYNDPDPIRWTLLYSGAAVCSFLFWRRIRIRFAALSLALAAITWALGLAVGETPAFPATKELFGQYMMTGSDVEVFREIGGLILVGGWMTFIGLRGDRDSH